MSRKFFWMLWLMVLFCALVFFAFGIYCIVMGFREKKGIDMILGVLVALAGVQMANCKPKPWQM